MRNCGDHHALGRGAALVAVLAVALGFLGLFAGPAQAEGSDINDLPLALQEFVPGTPAWASSPWMQARDCQGRGGDVGIWVQAAITATPQLLGHFQPSAFGSLANGPNQPLYQAILSGYRRIDTQIESAVPAGDCAADLASWAGSRPAMPPFRFPWAIDTTDNHQSGYSCTDANTDAAIGAQRLPCDGFYVSCAHASTTAAQQCASWDAVSDRYIRLVEQVRQSAIDAHPAIGTAAISRRAGWIGLVVIAGSVIVAVGAVVLIRRMVLVRGADRGQSHGGGVHVPRT
jgi:hypothetical protein